MDFGGVESGCCFADMRKAEGRLVFSKAKASSMTVTRAGKIADYDAGREGGSGINRLIPPNALTSPQPTKKRNISLITTLPPQRKNPPSPQAQKRKTRSLSGEDAALAWAPRVRGRESSKPDSSRGGVPGVGCMAPGLASRSLPIGVKWHRRRRLRETACGLRVERVCRFWKFCAPCLTSLPVPTGKACRSMERLVGRPRCEAVRGALIHLGFWRCRGLKVNLDTSLFLSWDRRVIFASREVGRQPATEARGVIDIALAISLSSGKSSCG